MSWGNFEGDVKTRWLADPADNHRNMELLEDFAYVDQFGKRWAAPAGSIVNGASIPKAFFATVGPPYVGNYRLASVVHDVACEDKSSPPTEVHQMFYNAMRCAGVSAFQAGLMYQAVVRFGPKWGAEGERPVMSFAAGRMPGTGVNEPERLVAAYKRAYNELGPQFELDELTRRVTEHMRHPPAKPPTAAVRAPAPIATTKASAKPRVKKAAKKSPKRAKAVKTAKTKSAKRPAVKAKPKASVKVKPKAKAAKKKAPKKVAKKVKRRR